ncbi:MAG: hypothetical protein KDC66_07575 [Phaeodactylibacter sp.]|nr:hypothetical protein [Phaeodactylibacter sp.]MCB9276956.1 ATPase [Lewinellaceae bacterium]
MKFRGIFNDRVLFIASLVAIGALAFDFGFRNNYWHQTITDSIYLAFGLLFFARMFRLCFRSKSRAVRLSRYIVLSISGFLVILAAMNLLEFTLFQRNLDEPTAFLVLFLTILDISERIYSIEKQTLHPALAFVLSFFFLISLGTAMLMLPLATVNGISFTDALFTSTSAVCVTGLTVLDTGKDFTLFGQAVILTLIQMGGLGILTFTNLFGLFFRGYGSYRNRLMLKDMINANDLGDTFSILIKIIVFTFLIELVGAVVIYQFLAPEHVPSTGRVFFALFHSVSAFCNAGFSTLSSSFYDSSYRFNYPLQLVLAMLIIFGGIGYNVFINYYQYLKKSLRHHFRRIVRRQQDRTYHRPVINANTKLVTITTLILLATGTAAYLFFEQNNSLAEHHGWGKLATAFFGAVTPRTAGFNTVDIASMALPTLMIYLLLMWIGASPGSTGGGIKTTTFAVATMTVYQQVLGYDRVVLGWKQVPQRALQRATSILLLSLIAIGLSTFLLMAIDGKLGLLPIAFECFSAYGTVGLSMGITSSLSDSSKLVLAVTMFVGRVNFLTILTGIARQFAPYRYAPIQYPEEDIFIN